jgi:hypothetical protein
VNDLLENICKKGIQNQAHPEGFAMSDFVLCIRNEGYPASLIVGKVYRRLPDPEAEARGMVRILDEDDAEPDGYLYPAFMFVPVELPEEARRVLMGA